MALVDLPSGTASSVTMGFFLPRKKNYVDLFTEEGVMNVKINIIAK